MNKTRVVPVRAQQVDRPELRRQLDEALVLPLTVIVAPAGAGKSTLLGQWVDAHPSALFVRIDIDDEDDDPVRFVVKMLDALSAVETIAEDVRVLVRHHASGLSTALIDALISELRRFPECVLVLDDLHRMTNETLLAGLVRLLRAAPAHVHVVIASRTENLAAKSRDRTGSQRLEIRQEDLALSVDESAQLIEQITGRSLLPEQVAALVDRTEGWAAGLQLAAVTLLHQDDPGEFIAQFNGTDRLIVDYLTEEILQVQSPERRGLLLRMSVLDRMTAGLVNWITHRDGAQLLFEELERESMFLVALDTNRAEFRFHQLFQDMLLYRLRAEDPSVEAEVLGLAATWHLDRGETRSGVEYLLRAQDWERVIHVLLTLPKDIYEQGEMLTVIRWIEEIPEQVRENHLDVWLLLGMLWGMAGQTANAEEILNDLLAHPRATTGQRKVASAYLAARVYFAARCDVSRDAAEQALLMLAERQGGTPDLLHVTNDRLLETLSLVSGARAHFLLGDVDESSQWAARALDSAGTSYPLYRVGALGTRALIDAWAGRLTGARLAALEALALARDVGGLFHPVIADAYLALAHIALEQGSLRSAALPLHEGIVRTSSNRRDQLLWVARLQSVEMEISNGHGDVVGAQLEQFSEEALTPPPPVVAQRLHAVRARLLRLGGAPEAARRELAQSDNSNPDVLFEMAAVALTLSQNDRARSLLADWTRSVESVPLENVQHLILRAWLAANEHNRATWRLRLLEAFDIAEPEGLVEVFVRSGGVVLALVAAVEGSHGDFRRATLDRARAAHMVFPGTKLLDPLTYRELEILSYLPSRYKNSELADICFVSLSTIKTHLASIYRKLGATTRDDAIISAKKAGLL